MGTSRKKAPARTRRARTSARGWLLAAAVPAVFAAFVGWSHLTAPPDPPGPPASAVLDPDVARLLESARASVRASKRDPAAWRALGYAYAASDMPALAAQCLVQSIELQEDAHAWHQLGVVLAQASDVEGSVAAFARAAELAPGHAPALWRAGLVLLEAGRLDEAAARFEAALRVDSSDPAPVLGLARVALQRGDAAAAERALAPLAAGGREASHARFLLARARALQGDEAAAEALQGGSVDATWHDPWDGDLAPYRVSRSARIAMSNAASVAGDRATAIAILEPLHRSLPDDETVALNLAAHYVAAGRAADGERTARELVERQPGLAAAHVNLALALNALGRHPEALTAASRAAEIDPRLATAIEQQANALGSLGRYAESAEAFGRARRLQPANASLGLGEGKALLMAGRNAEAVAALAEATRLDPSSEEAWRMRAMAEERAGDVAAAREAFTRAQALRATGSVAGTR